MSVECLVFVGDPQETNEPPERFTFVAMPRQGERVFIKTRRDLETSSYVVLQVSYLAESGNVAPEGHLIVRPAFVG